MLHSRYTITMLTANFLAACCPSAHASPPGDPKDWQLVPELSDEFNGSKLDTSKWRPQHAWYIGMAPSLFIPENVSISDGYLVLKTTPLMPGKYPASRTLGAPCVSSLLPIANSANYVSDDSGRVVRISPGYYYESRISGPSGYMSSAFFLQIKSGQEIDIAENWSASKNNPIQGEMFKFQARSNTHWFPNGYMSKNDTHSAFAISSPNTEFHVYGVWLKTPRQAEIYVDNRYVTTHYLRGDFTEPMYMFIDSEPSPFQGAPAPAEVAANPDQYVMKVDWVRTYRYSGAPIELKRK